MNDPKFQEGHLWRRNDGKMVVVANVAQHVVEDQDGCMYRHSGHSMQWDSIFIDQFVGDEQIALIYLSAKKLQDVCHAAAAKAGWWNHKKTGLDLRQVINAPKDEMQKLLGGALVAQKITLSHSELSEAMEGHRKGLMDDHLPHRPMIEVEIADAIIREMDLGGAMELDIAGALVEKMLYNANRPDHKPENREKDGGKSY